MDHEQFLEGCKSTISPLALNPIESHKQYIGITPLPNYIKLGYYRIELSRIKYYFASDKMIRIYLNDDLLPSIDIVSDRETPLEMVSKLDELLAVKDL